MKMFILEWVYGSRRRFHSAPPPKHKLVH